MTGVDILNIGDLAIIQILLPIVLAFLISFFVLFSFFSVRTKKWKFYIKSKVKRILLAFLLSFVLCPILFYIYVVSWQILAGTSHPR